VKASTRNIVGTASIDCKNPLVADVGIFEMEPLTKSYYIYLTGFKKPWIAGLIVFLYIELNGRNFAFCREDERTAEIEQTVAYTRGDGAVSAVVRWLSLQLSPGSRYLSTSSGGSEQ
jgi:hypothetical protein